jgi:hypothetical protein
MVEFRTIYPGWYPGRTVHVHLIDRTEGRVLTSQRYFPDATTDTVLTRQPYAGRPDRDTTNENDTIYPTGGQPAVLDLVATDHGYRAAICLELPETDPASWLPGHRREPATKSRGGLGLTCWSHPGDVGEGRLEHRSVLVHCPAVCRLLVRLLMAGGGNQRNVSGSE